MKKLQDFNTILENANKTGKRIAKKIIKNRNKKLSEILISKNKKIKK